MEGGWKAFGVTPTDNLVVAIFGRSCSCVLTRLPQSVALNVSLFVSCLTACNKECTLTNSLRRYWSCDTCDTPIDYCSKSRKAGLSGHGTVGNPYFTHSKFLSYSYDAPTCAPCCVRTSNGVGVADVVASDGVGTSVAPCCLRNKGVGAGVVASNGVGGSVVTSPGVGAGVVRSAAVGAGVTNTAGVGAGVNAEGGVGAGVNTERGLGAGVNPSEVGAGVNAEGGVG
jgi:hypothetical protein